VAAGATEIDGRERPRFLLDTLAERAYRWRDVRRMMSDRLAFEMPGWCRVCMEKGSDGAPSMSRRLGVVAAQGQEVLRRSGSPPIWVAITSASAAPTWKLTSVPTFPQSESAVASSSWPRYWFARVSEAVLPGFERIRGERIGGKVLEFIDVGKNSRVFPSGVSARLMARAVSRHENDRAAQTRHRRGGPCSGHEQDLSLVEDRPQVEAAGGCRGCCGARGSTQTQPTLFWIGARASDLELSPASPELVLPEIRTTGSASLQRAAAGISRWSGVGGRLQRRTGCFEEGEQGVSKMCSSAAPEFAYSFLNC